MNDVYISDLAVCSSLNGVIGANGLCGLKATL
jgi:calcineurin-like phosphoesterase